MIFIFISHQPRYSMIGMDWKLTVFTCPVIKKPSCLKLPVFV